MNLYKNLKFKMKNYQSGFTLIETLVALAIFASSIAGLISITATGIANTNYAKNKLIASYLAQEGVELVRNLRDSSALAGQDLQSFLQTVGPLCSPLSVTQVTIPGLFGTTISVPIVTGFGCTIDGSDPSPAPQPIKCPAGGCPNLKYDGDPQTGTGSYSYTLGNDSVFNRNIIIVLPDPTNSDEIQVTAEVKWTQGSVPRSVIYSENLTNWVQ